MLEEPATLAAPKVALVIMFLQFPVVVKMLIAPLTIIVLRALDPVLLQCMPGTEVDITVVAVMGHEGKMESLVRFVWAIYLLDLK